MRYDYIGIANERNFEIRRKEGEINRLNLLLKRKEGKLEMEIITRRIRKGLRKFK